MLLQRLECVYFLVLPYTIGHKVLILLMYSGKRGLHNHKSLILLKSFFCGCNGACPAQLFGVIFAILINRKTPISHDFLKKST